MLLEKRRLQRSALIMWEESTVFIGQLHCGHIHKWKEIICFYNIFPPSEIQILFFFIFMLIFLILLKMLLVIFNLSFFMSFLVFMLLLQCVKMRFSLKLGNLLIIIVMMIFRILLLLLLHRKSLLGRGIIRIRCKWEFIERTVNFIQHIYDFLVFKLLLLWEL